MNKNCHCIIFSPIVAKFLHFISVTQRVVWENHQFGFNCEILVLQFSYFRMVRGVGTMVPLLLLLLISYLAQVLGLAIGTVYYV